MAIIPCAAIRRIGLEIQSRILDGTPLRTYGGHTLGLGSLTSGLTSWNAKDSPFILPSHRIRLRQIFYRRHTSSSESGPNQTSYRGPNNTAAQIKMKPAEEKKIKHVEHRARERARINHPKPVLISKEFCQAHYLLPKILCHSSLLICYKHIRDPPAPSFYWIELVE